MSTDRDRFRIELDVEPRETHRSLPGESAQPVASNFGPFRIALIGDFSGRSSRSIVESRGALAERRPLRVDRDSVDEAMAQLAPKLSIAIGANGTSSEIALLSLDDFHPDRLYQRVPYFRALREAGARLAASASLAPRTAATPVGVLDAILGDTPLPPGGAPLAEQAVRASAPARADDGLAQVIARAVAPHLVPAPTASEEEARSRTDDEIAATMRALLHHADFQRLEALWRGVDFLVRRLDTDSSLQLYLVDVSPAELRADIGDGPIEESAIYRLFVDGRIGTPGMPAWALLAGAFSLGAADASVIVRLGELARDAGAALVADAEPRLAGVVDSAEPDLDDYHAETPSEWRTARGSSTAPYVSLLFPRILLRVPYGKLGEPCELFSFEEFSANRRLQHDELLWGSSALAGALAIGEGYTESGWAMQRSREISGLPTYVYRVDGEVVAIPCVERLIGERAAERLTDRGLTPLLGVREGDAVILPRLRSIAAEPTALAGRWNKASHDHGD